MGCCPIIPGNGPSVLFDLSPLTPGKPLHAWLVACSSGLGNRIDSRELGVPRSKRSRGSWGSKSIRPPPLASSLVEAREAFADYHGRATHGDGERQRSSGFPSTNGLGV
jgi:hypothetical protein